MSRELSSNVKALRLVGGINVRSLKRTGKCYLCKSRIDTGEKSCRYSEVIMGMRREVGICMDCLVKLWGHAKKRINEISVAISEYTGVDVEKYPIDTASCTSNNNNNNNNNNTTRYYTPYFDTYDMDIKPKPFLLQNKSRTNHNNNINGVQLDSFVG